MSNGGPLAVIAYDGSDGSRSAIGAVARLLLGRCVVVHVVQEDYATVLAPGVPGAAPSADAVLGELRAVREEEGRRIAEEGARLARAAGLDSEAVVHSLGAGGNIAGAIIAEAAERDADVIALGHRGHGAIRSMLLGSVSKLVVQQTDRPVLLVNASAAGD